MLTTTQLQALKTAILADSALSSQPNNDDGHLAIAVALNLTASPVWVVWRTAVSLSEVMQNGFDWARVDNLSIGKARIWEWMFLQAGTIDPSKTNVRAGIDACWIGTAPDLAVRAAVYAHCKLNASRAQKIFSTGTGTDATPAFLASNIDETFQLGYADVATARGLA